MTTDRILTLVSALLLICLLPVNGYSQEQDPDFFIFLAFGQSNMEGYPGIEEQDKTGVNSRFRLLPAVDWPDGSRKKGTWTTAVPPLCRSDCGLCPADYFGRTLVDSLPENIRVGIVNVSVAGCKIEMFDKDNYQGYIAGEASWMKNIVNAYGGNPYGRLVEIAKLAQKDGVIKGILFHQGESGAMQGNNWAQEVKKVYNNLIADLDLDAKKTPFIAGDLLSPSGMVQGLPNTLDNSYVVSSQGLQGLDQFHFTPASYREFGKRYGLKMLELIDITGVVDDKKGIRQRCNDGCGMTTDGRSSVGFTLRHDSRVMLQAFALNGAEIAVIADGEFSAGRHSVGFGSRLSAGAFIVRMTSGGFSMNRMVTAAGR